MQPSSNFSYRKILYVLSYIVIIGLLIPWYQLVVKSTSIREMADFMLGNGVLIFFLIYGGRYFLYAGAIVALHRALELSISYYWGDFFPGISRFILMKILNEDISYTLGYIESDPFGFIAWNIFILFYILLYILCVNNISNRVEYKNLYKFHKKPFIKYTFCSFFIFIAIYKKSSNDIYLWENKYDNTQELVFMDKEPPISKKNYNIKNDVYIIIGESLSKSNLSLYKYHRETTPYLSKIHKNGQLFKWESPYAAGPNTPIAIMTMFSKYTKYNYEGFFKTSSIVTEFKNMGYNTVWLSYDKDHSGKDGFVFNYLADNADQFLYSNNNNDDMLVAKLLNKVNNKKGTVFFIHTLGSHVNYKNRTPQKYKKYSLLKAKNSKQKTINEYDDSVLYTDRIIKYIHNYAKKRSAYTNNNYSIIYFSDHGQNLYKDGTNWYGHPASTKQYNGFYVPFFIINHQGLPCYKNLPLNLQYEKIGLNNMFYWLIGSNCGYKGKMLKENVFYDDKDILN